MEDMEEFGVRLKVLGDARVDVHSSVASAKVVIRDSDSKLSSYNVQSHDVYLFFKGISVGFREPRYIFTEPETQESLVEIQVDARGTATKQYTCNVEYTDGTAIGQCVYVLFIINYYYRRWRRL